MKEIYKATPGIANKTTLRKTIANGYQAFAGDFLVLRGAPVHVKLDHTDLHQLASAWAGVTKLAKIGPIVAFGFGIIRALTVHFAC